MIDPKYLVEEIESCGYEVISSPTGEIDAAWEVDLYNALNWLLGEIDIIHRVHKTRGLSKNTLYRLHSLRIPVEHRDTIRVKVK